MADGNDKAKRLAEEVREGEKQIKERQRQNREALKEGFKRDNK